MAKPLAVLLFPLLLLACGDDEEVVVEAGPGETCSTEVACETGFTCADNGAGANICQRPAGTDCDLADASPFCIVGTECVSRDSGGTADGSGEGSGTTGPASGFCAIPDGGTCDPALDDPICAPSLICVEHAGAEYRCRWPVVIRGMVFDAQTEAAIEGALVIALNEESVAVTDVAVTAADGSYELDLPTVRDADGNPDSPEFVTMRASAADYQPFPSGIRTALPIDVSDATQGGAEAPYALESTLTEIALIELPAAERGRASISGDVVGATEDTGVAGVLIVVETGGGAFTGLSDSDGEYTVFNVPDGAANVAGYIANVQLTPVDVTVAGADLTDVDLLEASEGTVTVSGTLQYVNRGSPPISVVLVVESTFSDVFLKGEVGAGLRDPTSGPVSVESSWSIEGVPAGTYLILAAFENDGQVRDPDTSIAGTEILRLVVSAGGEDIMMGDSFKVTEALAVIQPGADAYDVVTSAPTLEWADDSSEEWYVVQVYNALGDLVMEVTDVPSVSGADTVSVPYTGPLDPGMFYQFRATSWRQSGNQDPVPISSTEDLRGVFQAAPNE